MLKKVKEDCKRNRRYYKYNYVNYQRVSRVCEKFLNNSKKKRKNKEIDRLKFTG